MGIPPDLTTLGKIVGGGLPVGAYGGRAEIMDHVLPRGKVFQAGTLSGNPLATAAGIATLRILRDSAPYSQLEERARTTGYRAGQGGNRCRNSAHDRARRQHADVVFQFTTGHRLGSRSHE